MALFVFIGCGTAVMLSSPQEFNYALQKVNPSAALNFNLNASFAVGTALAFGLTITFLAYAVGFISGGHINCTVSWGFFLAGKLSAAQLIANTIAQLLGSILGAGLLYGTVPNAAKSGLGTNALQPGVSVGNAILGEIVMTMTLVFTVLMTTSSAAKEAVNNLAAIPIGLSVFAAHAVLLAVDGCSINPSRSFGPALLMGKWDNFWVFVVGPYVGSTLAVLCYFIFASASKQEQQEEAQMAALAGVDVKPGYGAGMASLGSQSNDTLVEMSQY